MSAEPKIPCHNCICFALCNAKIKKLPYKSQFLLRELDACELLSEWAYKRESGYTYRIRMQYMKAFCDVFNLKMDIEPDTALLRHLHEHDRDPYHIFPMLVET